MSNRTRSDKNEVIIRPMALSDVRAVARLHCQEIDFGFISTLGERFLRNLYRGLFRSGQAIVLVAERNGQVVGFAAATPGVDSLYKKTLRACWWRFALILLPRMVSPRVIRHCWETLRHPHAKDEQDLPRAEVLSIAVDRRFARRGIGRRLMTDVLEAMWARGIDQIRVSVLKSAAGANAFYPKLGFRLAREIQVHRRAINIYICDNAAIAKAKEST